MSPSRHHPFATLGEFEQVQTRLYEVPALLWGVAVLAALATAVSEPAPATHSVEHAPVEIVAA